MPTAIILMGVSGCGKTSVGEALSDKLDWPFYDGDDFHPLSNINKMASGISLNDIDRQPWLERLHRLITAELGKSRSLLVACSALKKGYREILRGDLDDVQFVHLEGSFDLIYSRIQKRGDHYMREEMLRSQFKILEPPENAISLSIEKSIQQIIDGISENLGLIE